MRTILFVGTVSAFVLFSNWASAQRVRMEMIEGAFSANDMSSDGRYVVGGLNTGEDYLWDAFTDTWTILPEDGLLAAAVSDDGTVVVGDMINPETPDTTLGNVAGMWTASQSLER